MVPEGKVTAEILVSVPCHKNTANYNKGKSYTQQYYMHDWCDFVLRVAYFKVKHWLLYTVKSWTLFHQFYSLSVRIHT